jgi:hypothetical protein
MTSELGPDVPRYFHPNLDAMLDRRKPTLERLGASHSVAINLSDFQQTLALTARTEGVTWGEIGRMVGLTKQGAHMRFGVGPDHQGAAE